MVTLQRQGNNIGHQSLEKIAEPITHLGLQQKTKTIT
jgi:hypothetical protein